MFSTWLGEVTLVFQGWLQIGRRLMPKKHNIFGYWILSVYMCSLVCHSHNLLTPAVYKVQNGDVGTTRSYFNPSINGCNRSGFAKNHLKSGHPLLHPVDSGHWHPSFWAVKTRITVSKTQTNLLCLLFYFLSSNAFRGS